MTQHSFLIRCGSYGSQPSKIVHSSGEGIRYDYKTKQSDDGSRHVTTAPNKDVIVVRARAGDLEANGTRALINWAEGLRKPFTAAAVKKTVRRIRPADAAALDVIDADLADLQGQIVVLRQVREATVKAAWTQGHVVRLQEVVAWADERVVR